MIETNIIPVATPALVVVVEMEIEPQHCMAFMQLLRRNAANSRACEDGCLVFDVCVPEVPQDPPTVLLYELYASANAFELHLASEHFKAFDALTCHMVRKKSVRRYRLQPWSD
ncbi:MAG: putative quinol monooxygenase [Lautropia sp.]|nr:putative quinol monooxygenase [Lautropia sp.]